MQAIRGMNDILPEQTPLWRYFEGTVARLLDGYGYGQIRMPIVEFTELFKRSIGEVTDIVEKEMYTFEDRNGDSLTLRPEGTAACVRAVLEHGITYSRFIHALQATGIEMDRKVLAAIAYDDPASFSEIVRAVQATMAANANEPAAEATAAA